MTTVCLERVDKYFGPRQVLHGVSLRLAPGEIVGLLGPNGSGKTTTMRLVAGYYRPDAGQVKWEGAPSSSAARQVGYLPEKAPLYDALTLEHYLEFVGRCKGLRGQRLAAQIERAVSAFDLQAVRRSALGRLSKGLRQRVGLAQAILGDPPVLLLDEATNGLDPMQIVQARQMIRAVAAGRAVLFSSHLMQEVQALCTRAVILHQGHLVADLPLPTGSAVQGRVVQLRWQGARPSALRLALQALPGVQAVLPLSQQTQAEQPLQLEVRYEHAPAELDALLDCALRHGHVLDVQRATGSVEAMLLQAMAQGAGHAAP